MDTSEEILKTMDYKVIKKTLMRQYPFVIDIIPSEDHEKYKTLTFFDVILDGKKLNEYMDGATVSGYMDTIYSDRDRITTPYLSILYPNPKDSIKAKDLQQDIEDIMVRVHKSSVIDPSMKMRRTPNISTMVYVK